VFAHNPLIFGAPLCFHLAQFRLADHFVKPGAELAGNATGFAHPFAHCAHHARQILRPNHDQRDYSHQQKFAGCNVKHGGWG
jgi:hypothetical protein